jgi:hypothetical protein
MFKRSFYLSDAPKFDFSSHHSGWTVQELAPLGHPFAEFKTSTCTPIPTLLRIHGDGLMLRWRTARKCNRLYASSFEREMSYMGLTNGIILPIQLGATVLTDSFQSDLQKLQLKTLSRHLKIRRHQR